MSSNILAGIRVFDMTRVLAGPYCTALMADLGAEVIKLEPPHGDEYRHIGPFREGESALFHLTNRGKQSIVIDLQREEGRMLAQELALSCDVVVENFRPGVAAKLGLGAESLRQQKPQLVYASISGFGQRGPWTNKPAYDLIVQALSGLMAVNGEEGGSPLKVGESIGDLAAGLFASWAVLGALFRRERTAEGSTIDVSMHDALFSLLPTAHAQLFFGGREPARTGNRHPLSTPFGCYAAQDGMFAVAVLNEKHFAILAEVIGHPGLAEDPHFMTDNARTQHEPQLKTIIESWSHQRTASEAVAALEARQIPCAMISKVSQAAASDQTVQRKLVTALQHPTLSTVQVVGQPVVFDQMKPVTMSAAPALGADALTILRNTPGFDAERIKALFSGGTIKGSEHAKSA